MIRVDLFVRLSILRTKRCQAVKNSKGFNIGHKQKCSFKKKNFFFLHLSVLQSGFLLGHVDFMKLTQVRIYVRTLLC